MEKKQICIIGLGKFGMRFAKFVSHQGHEVMGIDIDPEKVSRAKDILTDAYHVDLIDRDVLRQVGISEFSHVVISVGDSITASMMISLYMRELGAGNIWVKAVNHDHQKLLNMLGVDRVIIPEEMAASQLANELTMPGFIDYIPFDSDMIMHELVVSKWAGKTLKDLNITNKYGIQAVAIKEKGESQFCFIPKAESILNSGDIIVVIGHKNSLNKVKA